MNKGIKGERHYYERKINKNIGDALYGPNTTKLSPPKKDTNEITIHIENASSGAILTNRGWGRADVKKALLTFNKNITIKEMKERVKNTLFVTLGFVYDVSFYNEKQEEIKNDNSDTVDTLFKGVDYPVIAVSYNLSTELHEIKSDFYVIILNNSDEVDEFWNEMSYTDRGIDGETIEKFLLCDVPEFIDEYITTNNGRGIFLTANEELRANYMMVTAPGGLFYVFKMIQRVGMILGKRYTPNSIITTQKGGITVIDISDYNVPH